MTLVRMPVQSNPDGTGPYIVAPMMREMGIGIRDLKTGKREGALVVGAVKCAASHCFIAGTSMLTGFDVHTFSGEMYLIVPDCLTAFSVTIHPHYPYIVVLGFGCGIALVLNLKEQLRVSLLEAHEKCISSMTLVADGRLFMSSWDQDASILTLNTQFKSVSCIKLKGHTKQVNDILPLTLSDQCVTGSDDKTIKVWDNQTGACLRTLAEHTRAVTSLALHRNGKAFASGSKDCSVVVYSTETFEVLKKFNFENHVESLAFGYGDALYAGVTDTGVEKCYVSGGYGPVVLRGQGAIHSVCFGMRGFYL